MNDAPEFQPYGLPHLTVIFITIVLPFALAALVRRTKSQRIERVIVAFFREDVSSTLELMRRLKAALDPQGILAPGMTVYG